MEPATDQAVLDQLRQIIEDQKGRGVERPPGAFIASELAAGMRWGTPRTRRFIRQLIEDGKAEPLPAGVPIRNMVGRVTHVDGYRLIA